jgi:hypothetical protein
MRSPVTRAALPALVLLLGSSASLARAATWTAAPRMKAARNWPKSTLLAEGRVLVAGGTESPYDEPELSTAEIYDEVRGTWTTTAAPPFSPTTLVTLRDGRVFAGGRASAAFYDPATDRWTAASGRGSRGAAAAYVLAGGKLVTLSDPRGTSPAALDVYDPSSDRWTAVPLGSFGTSDAAFIAPLDATNAVVAQRGPFQPDRDRGFHCFVLDTERNSIREAKSRACTMPLSARGVAVLGSGEWLVAVPDESGNKAFIARFLLGTESFTTETEMLVMRASGFTFSVTGSGRLFVSGGARDSDYLGPLDAAELYDLPTKRWTAAPKRPDGVNFGAGSVTLKSGRILVFGGYDGRAFSANATSATWFFDDLAGGAACTTDAQCGSGFCTDGVCCDARCDAQCEACNEPGKAGTCSPVVGAPRGARPACEAGGDTCKSASCDGSKARGSCVGRPGSETVCAAGSCSGTEATPEGRCDGAGGCVVAAKTSCAPYVCGANACKTACDTKADCAAGHRCQAKVCVREAETTCATDGATSIRTADGQATPCAPYRCDDATGGCRATCTKSDDCVEATCDLAAGRCVVAGGSEAAPGDGCGCGIPGARPRSAIVAALAALVVGLVRRRRGHARSARSWK